VPIGGANYAPLLLLSQASAAALHEEIRREQVQKSKDAEAIADYDANWRRFRPNVLIADVENAKTKMLPFEEDLWRKVRLGGSETSALTTVELCGRCPHPRINPFSGQVDVPQLAVILHSMGRTALAMREKISVSMPSFRRLIFSKGLEQELIVAKTYQHVFENWIEVKKNERKPFAGICMDCDGVRRLKVGDTLVVEELISE
jgi:hypothetical protein